jgi:prephenate dehydrogenase
VKQRPGTPFRIESGGPKPETGGVHWKKITLVGVGLLGGSLGLALRQRRLTDFVTGYVRRSASVAECLKAGAVDEATCDLAAAVAGAELVVLCTPISQMRELVEQLLPALQRRAIVTDVGSVKGSVVHELEPLVAKAGAHFIGSHPMAGAEKMGVTAARADLFLDAVCVVTPTSRSSPTACRRITRFWKSLGSRVLSLSPEAHDELVSRSSHLPHMLAATLARFVLNPDHPLEQQLLCANGFRDTTRVASGSPEMWRDIALANRHNLSQTLGGFMEDLRAFRRALKKGDGPALAKFFEQAKQRRDQWSSKLGSSSPE